MLNEIEEQLMMGAHPKEVAKFFNVSLNYVHEIQEDLLNMNFIFLERQANDFRINY